MLWLKGLENLADITRNSFYILRVDMQDFAGRSAFAEYRCFGFAHGRKIIIISFNSLIFASEI